MASHPRQQQQPHHRSINNTNNIRSANISQNGSDTNGSNGNGDLYQQLIDSNDLVKELDDIEAISQQISQHAEVLYQSWKQQEASKQQQNTAGHIYKQSNTLPSNSSRASAGHIPSPSTGSLPRTGGGYQPGDFTKRATSPLKVHENGKSNNGVPFHKQNGNHNPPSDVGPAADRRMPSSHPPNLTASPDVYSRLPISTDQQHLTAAGPLQNPQYQNIKRQTLSNNVPSNNITSQNNSMNPLSSSTSGLTSPSFISSASNASSQKSNTVLPVSSRSIISSENPTTVGQQFYQQPPASNNPSIRSSTLPTTSMNSNNTTSNNRLSEENPNPKSSEQQQQHVGRSLELLATPEVNGNLKDLVNSFVSTDRAKQAARQTISNTINNMSRRNGSNGIRSPSPSNTASSSSPFSSRGVSPLRSPMLAAASNNPGPQAVLNSLHVISSPPPSTTSSLSSLNTNLHPNNPSSIGPSSSGPLSPSASSTSSTSSSIDSQMNRSISNTTDPTSNVHTKLNPMFSRTPSLSNSSSSNNEYQQKQVSSPTVVTPVSPSWPADQNTIPIPVQHIRINDGGKPTSSSTLMMTGNKGGPLNANNLRSPRVLQNMTSSTGMGTSNQKQLQPPTRQTSLEFELKPPNLSSLHDQHIESMRQKFEEAKQRMSILHQRVRTGSDSSLISTSRPPGLSMRSPFDSGSSDPFDVDSIDASDDSSNHSSYLFDQFRRRVARSKRETPSAPHPELTPQQRQHIFERTSSTGSLLAPRDGSGSGAMNAVNVSPNNRRFLSGGSVAERVLIFERSPFAMEGRSMSTGNLLDKKKESNIPNWKSSQYDAQQKAQVRYHICFKNHTRGN